MRNARLGASGIRKNSPRFGDDHIDANLVLLDRVKALAQARGCTLGQIALAWLFAKGPDIAPIPGTKRIRYLEENAAAVEIILAPQEVAEIDAGVDPEAFSGSRLWTPDKPRSK